MGPDPPPRRPEPDQLQETHWWDWIPLVLLLLIGVAFAALPIIGELTK